MKYLTLPLFLLFSSIIFSQEICNNGIDDDGDGLIDLNDTEECLCNSFVGLGSLIPNPSFEDFNCCPSGYAELLCAETWIQASTATSDYWNVCGADGPEDAPFDEGIPNPDFPLPGGGEGYVGFISRQDFFGVYNEYIGACLLSPMLAGETYIFHFYVSRGSGAENLNLSVFGTPDCTDLPWIGGDCPEGIGGWELLGETPVVLETASEWIDVVITIIPDVDINAIVIGGPCDPEPAMIGGPNYYYLDGLSLFNEDLLLEIQETGNWCSNDLELSIETDTIGETWQWYKDGIALIGETDATVGPNSYGPGNYEVHYTVGDYCGVFSYEVSTDSITADFDFETVCAGEELSFTNTSEYAPELNPDWSWNFGDGASSTEENPGHFYDNGGTYSVELIITETVCADTITYNVDVIDKPNTDFDFIVNDIPSTTNICINSIVEFNNQSTIAPPYFIVDWFWTFGDGATSTEENPEHLYDELGEYTVSLVAESNLGCKDTALKTNLIVVHPFPNPNFTATPNPMSEANTRAQLTNINPNPTSFFSWYLPESLEEYPSYEHQIEAQYPEFVINTYEAYLIETTEFNCTDTAQLTIGVKPDQIIYAPNTFTPDGDNINNYWRIYIKGIDIYDFHLTIFNRWGEIVWESYNPEAAWDGTYGNGSIVKDGTYIWTVKTKGTHDDKVHEFDGTITILR